MDKDTDIKVDYIFCSSKYNFVWIDIPKVASTSIRNFLKKEVSDLQCLGAPWHGVDNIQIQDFKKNQNKYFTFCFSRNPWCRLVSFYKMIKQRKRRQNKFKKLYETKYNNELLIDCSSFTFNFFCKHIYDFLNINDRFINHINPQTSFIYRNINFCGKFENFQEDFNIICDKIGIPQQQLPHANKTGHKNYTEYYDDETKKIVAEIYAKDIEYFGYKFGE